MSRRTIGTAIGVAALVCEVVSFAAFAADWLVLDRRPSTLDEQVGMGVYAVALLLLISAGLTVVRHRPASRIGWAVLVGASSAAVSNLADSYVWWGQIADSTGHVYDQAYVLPGRQYAGWLYGVFNAVWITGGLCLVFLLYPDGRLPSRKWRPLAVVVGALGALGLLARSLGPGVVGSSVVSTPNPFGQSWLSFLLYRLEVFGRQRPLINLAVASALVLTTAAPLTRLLRRPRQGVPMRLFATAAVSLAGIILFDLVRFATGTTGRSDTVPRFIVGLSLLAVAIAVVDAVFRHQLDEIQVALRRATMFGCMSLMVAVVYVATTTAVGAAANQAGLRWAVPLSATGLAALGLQPVRDRADLLAARLIYGARPSPAELLESVANGLASAASIQAVLPQLATTLREAFGADRAEVDAGGVQSSSGASGRGTALEVEVQFLDERAGSLRLERSAREPWRQHERELLELVAAQVAPAFNTVRIDADLRLRMAEAERQARTLQESQQRIVSAQLAARVRFSDEVHQRVWPLLDEVETALGLGDAGAARAAADRALAEVRRIGHGLDPSELRDLGPVAALAAEARDLGVRLDLHVGGSGGQRWPDAVERTLYLVMAPLIRAATGHHVEIDVDATSTELRFHAVGAGSLADVVREEIEDRVSALGGEVEVSGPSLRGFLPVMMATAET